MQISLPTQWRGGLVTGLDKGHGGNLPEHARDITMMDDEGKVYMGILRHSLNPALSRYTFETQVGSGLHTASAESCSILAQSLISHAISVDKSVAVLFLDIKTAFAAMIRAIAVPSGWDDSLFDKLVGLGLDPQLAREVQSDWRGGYSYGGWTNADGSLHALHLLADAHQRTWFCMDAVDQFYTPTTGTLAGTPLADAVFTMFMKRLLLRIRPALRNELSVATITRTDHSHTLWGPSATELPTTLEYPGISLMDDATLAIAASADQLIDTLQRTITVVYDVCLKAGVPLNMSPHKTSAIVRFGGSGMRAARIQHGKTQSLWFSSVTGVQYLAIVQRYKHMGILLNMGSSRGAELRSRARSMKASLGALRAKVFRNSNLHLKDKLTVMRSLALSKGIYGSGALPVLSTTDQKAAYSLIMAAYKSVVPQCTFPAQQVDRAVPPPVNTLDDSDIDGEIDAEANDVAFDEPPDQHIVADVAREEVTWHTDAQILQRTGLPHPMDVLSMSRIREFIRMVRLSGPATRLILAESLGDPNSWLNAVYIDLQRIADTTDEFADMRSWTLGQWVAHANDTSCHLLPTLHRLFRSRSRVDQMAQWYSSFRTAQRSEDAPMPCPECGVIQRNRNALWRHCQSAHNAQAALRLRVKSPVCQCCGVNYITLTKLMSHLVDKRNARCCKHFYMRTQPLVSKPILDAAMEFDLARRKSYGPGRSCTYCPYPAVKTKLVSPPLGHTLLDAPLEDEMCQTYVDTLCNVKCYCCDQDLKLSRPDLVDTRIPPSSQNRRQ